MKGMRRCTRGNDHHQRLLLTFLCMLSALRVRGFIVVARTSSAFSKSKYCTPRSTFLHLASNNSINGEGDNDESSPKRAKTGWNHNLPDESSDFWEGGLEEAKSSSSSAYQPTELRTGWLHNTEPRSQQQDDKQASKSEDTGVSPARRRLQQAMKEQERNHRIIAAPTFHACGHCSVVVTEHKISLPLNRPGKTPRIDIYFSIVEKVDSQETRQLFESLVDMSPEQRSLAYVDYANMTDADDMILYLQGGPGFGAPTPVVSLSMTKDSSWGAKALELYDRIVLMDQRGTGRSSAITKQTLERRFPDLFLLDEEAARQSLENLQTSQAEKVSRVKKAVEDATDFLSHFRSDNIVQDAEEIRDALIFPTMDDEGEDPKPWGCSLGQSFGGFCQMSYLSLVENPPKVCLFTGGIAPMLTPLYDTYSSLWERVKERSLFYYDMYPSDVALVKKIVKRLLDEPATLPSGGTLTARRFLQLGLALGGSPSSFAALHDLFTSAFIDADAENLEFSRAFLKQIDSHQSFDDAPFYFWLHESIYANGPEHSPTNWAAHRAYEDRIKSPSEFDYRLTSAIDSDDRPVLFFGEMVFPWMYEDFAELQGVGLASVAETLASKKDWGPLFHGERMRKVLDDGRTKAAAAVYHGDMYVDFDCSMKVAGRGGPLEKCKVWVTNDCQHSGLRDDGATIFAKLHGMATGKIRCPS